MAKRKASSSDPTLDPMTVIARLLALIVTKGVEKDEAALQLSAAGLDAKAITDLLGVSGSYVRKARFNRTKKNAKTKNR